MDKICNYLSRVTLSNYNMAIQSFLKIQELDAARKARKILDRLIEIHEKENENFIPDTLSFNTVMYISGRIHGSNAEKAEALQLAQGTYQDLCEFEANGGPDKYTYDALLECAINLLPERNVKQRNQLISAIITKCCDAGFISTLAIARLKTNAYNVYKNLILTALKNTKRGNRINLEDLPAAWSRRVNERKKYRRNQ